jgi:acyl-CoA synthetase (AMP-forming)/AMP-acid ligase II
MACRHLRSGCRRSGKKLRVNLLDQAVNKLWVGKTLAEVGIVRPIRPDKLARMAMAFRKWGTSPALGYTVSAIRHPDAIAIVDELGTLTFTEVEARTNALAHAFADEGIGAGDGVAILCRNHRGFIDATVACAKIGAHALYLNTQFSGPQITEVLDREEPVAIVYDEEFSEMVEEARKGRKAFIAWFDGPDKPDCAIIEDLVEQGDPSPLPAPDEKPRFVILTSGTTGTPKGASRESPDNLDPIAALFDKIPMRYRQSMMIAAPLFHSWGYLHFNFALGLGATIVLRRKFDPETTLSDTAQHNCETLVVVPVMLQRILDLGEETIKKYDLSALRTINASGSALPGELATRVMDAFGDVLYNLYGSTEVAWATIATPEDLRAAPGTAGKPPRNTVVKIYDEDGKELPQGETGRIFVGNEMQFEGYTGGGGKDEIEGLLSSGDVGHFDDDGRLFIDGRDDEMIVSGGENVFPREVEDLLADHDKIDEAAVIGVDDEKFGQRLKAFVVTSGGNDVSEDEIKQYVKENLAGYKVPREVEFLDELPRNATGKVVKKQLAGEGGEDEDGDENGGEESREESEAEGARKG